MFFGKSGSNESKKKSPLLLSHPMFELTSTGIIQAANPKALQIFNCPSSGCEGQKFFQWLSVMCPEGQFDVVDFSTLSPGESREVVYGLKIDASDLKIRASFNPYFDESGKCTSVLVVLEDLSAESHAQKALHTLNQAIDHAVARIEFTPMGVILDANSAFLQAMGYTLEEVKGQHHRIFMDPEEARTAEYQDFWVKLGRGAIKGGEFRRFAKGSREVWIQATYAPVYDEGGRLVKIVKFAMDVTAQRAERAAYHALVESITRTQAVIHFKPDGTILDANENFLNFMGYRLDEIQGQHHRMFMPPEDVDTPEYRALWQDLAAGKFLSRVFRRRTKNGKIVWIQAAYNPVLNDRGEVVRVVKCASDLTDIIEMTESTNKNVKGMADAASLLGDAITKVNSYMDMSRQSTEEIVARTTVSGKATDDLVQSMKSMERVLEFIREIAEQVNLLALNATIEAARAGDQGRSFAVVASEIKNLAKQTSNATDEISKEISTIQTISNQVAQGVQDIIQTSDQVKQYVNHVAEALKDQLSITRDISQKVTSTSQAVEEVVRKVRQG
ncbi:MAG: PAS domain-containing protein [Holosporales bacterium]